MIYIVFQRIFIQWKRWNTMLITIVCVIFLIKLQWPKIKSSTFSFWLKYLPLQNNGRFSSEDPRV